jgi:hypothetical protein
MLLARGVSVTGAVAPVVGYKQVNTALVVERSNPFVTGHSFTVTVEVEYGGHVFATHPEPAVNLRIPLDFYGIGTTARNIELEIVVRKKGGISYGEYHFQDFRPVQERDIHFV